MLVEEEIAGMTAALAGEAEADQPGSGGQAHPVRRHRPMGNASSGGGLAIAAQKPASSTKLRVAALLAIGLLLGASGYYARYWWSTGRYLVTTDDAYVGSRNATLSPKVSGYICELAVEE